MITHNGITLELPLPNTLRKKIVRRQYLHFKRWQQRKQLMSAIDGFITIKAFLHILNDKT